MGVEVASLPPLTDIEARRNLSGEPRPFQTILPTMTPGPPPLDSDLDRLQWIVKDWVYRGYAAIGQRKRGRFSSRKMEGKSFNIEEGQQLDGVTIVSLDRLAAIAGLGEATVTLPYVRELDMSLEDLREAMKDGPPSQEEVQKRMTEYWENYGKYFKEIGKRYTPKPGEIMPPDKPPSAEAVETAKARYYEVMMPTFQARAARRTPVPGEIMPQPQTNEMDQQQAVENYFKKYRPGQTPPPMPNR